MSISPVAMYGDLLSARPEAGAVLRHDDGHVTPLEVGRWLAPTCPVDEAIADAAVGPVLDVGCGPGRLLDALAHRGKWALGVDLSPAAVALAHDRGRRALLGDVFDDLPGAGSWETALLLDGSVGIGGDVGALLGRLGVLLSPSGRAIVEVEAPGSGTRAGRVRLEHDGVVSDSFDWAHVDTDGIHAFADVKEIRCLGGRWFAWVA